MKSANEKDQVVQRTLESRGMNPEPGDANTLRRAELTLSRWAEWECGTEYGGVERDEKTGIPYWVNARTGRRVPTGRKAR